MSHETRESALSATISRPHHLRRIAVALTAVFAIVLLGGGSAGNPPAARAADAHPTITLTPSSGTLDDTGVIATSNLECSTVQNGRTNTRVYVTKTELTAPTSVNAPLWNWDGTNKVGPQEAFDSGVVAYFAWDSPITAPVDDLFAPFEGHVFPEFVADGVAVPGWVLPGDSPQSGTPRALKELLTAGAYTLVQLCGLQSLEVDEVVPGAWTLRQAWTRFTVDADGNWAVAAAPVAVATTTTLTATVNADRTVALAAQVTAADGAVVDGGEVQFRRGDTAIGASAVKAGSAALTTAAMDAGTFTFQADYVPATTAFTGSVAPGISVTVSGAPSEKGTSITIAAVPAVRDGKPMIGLGAVVFHDGTAAADAVGTVQFLRDDQPVGSPTPVGGGTAAYVDTGIAFDTDYRYQALFTPGEGSALKSAKSDTITARAASPGAGPGTNNPGGGGPGTNKPASFATDWVGQLASSPLALGWAATALVVLTAVGLVGWNLFWRRRAPRMRA